MPGSYVSGRLNFPALSRLHDGVSPSSGETTHTALSLKNGWWVAPANWPFWVAFSAKSLAAPRSSFCFTVSRELERADSPVNSRAERDLKASVSYAPRLSRTTIAAHSQYLAL